MFVSPGEPLPEGGVAIKRDPSPNGLLVHGLEKCRYILTVCPLGGLLLQTLPAGLFLALFPLHLGLSFRRRSAFLSPGNLNIFPDSYPIGIGAAAALESLSRGRGD